MVGGGGTWGGVCAGQVVPTTEICDNVDNDCDGAVDEGLTRSCYTGPSGTSGVGICRPGTQTCSAGSWGSTCPGETLPATERCNAIDDNCNGATDEPFSRVGCQAVTGGSGTYTIDTDGSGPRAPVSVYCDMSTSGGGWTVIYRPSTTNNNTSTLDYTVNDPVLLSGASDVLMAYRDGSMNAFSNWATFGMPANWRVQAPFRYTGNDDVVSVSVNGAPAVTSTLRYGLSNFSSACTDPWVTSSPYGRICLTTTVAPYYNAFAVGSGDFCPHSSQGYSAVNCSASFQYTLAVRGTSSALSTTCTAGVGACARTGAWVCNGAQTGTTCSATPATPTAETCNGIDDDCDGTIDDGVTRSCYTGPGGTAGVGACTAGTETCVVGGAGTWGSCTGQVLPSSEVCDNVDNNCNGTRDESLTRSCYTGASGTSGVGTCRPGTQTCMAGSWGSTCPGEVVPRTELCDSLDDDCDGVVDDPFQPTNPFVSNGADGAFNPTSNVTLAARVYNFTTINIPSGVTVFTNGTGRAGDPLDGQLRR